MRGIAMENGKKKFGVLLPDGRFLMIKSDSYSEIGKELVFDESQIIDLKRQLSFKIIYSVAAVFVLMLVSLAVFTYNTPDKNIYAYIDLDINPGMEFYIDDKHKVIGTKSLSKEGNDVLKDLKLKGLDIRDAILEAVDNAEANGYLKDGGAVLISGCVNNSDLKNQDTGINKLFNSLKDRIKKEEIRIEYVEITMEQRKLAMKADISMGRYYLYIKAKEYGISLSMDEARNGNIKDLLDRIIKPENKPDVTANFIPTFTPISAATPLPNLMTDTLSTSVPIYGDTSQPHSNNGSQTSVPLPSHSLVLEPAKSNTTFEYVHTVSIDKSIECQEIEGFGAFGGKRPDWIDRKTIHDKEFVNNIIEDLGATIIRTSVGGNFERNNDNNDPYVTDFNAYNTDTYYGDYEEHAALRPWLNYLKDAKSKANSLGEELKVITSIWSPPRWMKYIDAYHGTDRIWNRISNGIGPVPGVVGEKGNMYPEYAEFLYAYTRIFKRETGFDLYALSIQNEPAFAQTYVSCVYSPQQYRDMLVELGRRLKKENVKVKLFGPEDTQALHRIHDYLYTLAENREARDYLDIMAVHGSANGSTTLISQDTLWSNIRQMSDEYNYPLWMTETSGYKDNWDGAMGLANAIHSALKYGRVSAWVWWSFSESKSSEYSLMTNGVPTSRYYTSKNYYKYVRPGSVMVKAESKDPDIRVTAFNHKARKMLTVVLINNSDVSKSIDIGFYGSNFPDEFTVYRTSATENCINAGRVSGMQSVMLPPSSVTTLYGSYTAADKALVPYIINQPKNISVQEGTSTEFSVFAIGTPNLSYQWYKNGTALTGETGQTYRVNSASLADNGSEIYVKIKSPYGIITSRRSVLTVKGFNGLSIEKISLMPSIDGNMDSAWHSIPSYTLGRKVIGSPAPSDLSGSFKLAWDDDNLYVFADIVDDKVVSVSGGSDSIELFFDSDNSRRRSYDSNDFQFVFKYGKDTVVETKHAASNDIKYKSVKTDRGYAIEACIPWSVLGTRAYSGKIVGFDVCADDTDDQKDGIRESKISYNTANNDIWFNPSNMGVGRLN
ncbi:MAG: sugar-binding protein [Bacillota bacterium]